MLTNKIKVETKLSDVVALHWQEEKGRGGHVSSRQGLLLRKSTWCFIDLPFHSTPCKSLIATFTQLEAISQHKVFIIQL